MKLYEAAGPNSRVVRMFRLEKGLDMPRQVLVLGTGDNQTPAFLAKNPMGQLPVLETGEGACISETLAICEYLEEVHPEPCLIGRTPAERAETRMWTRRVDLNIAEPILHAFRFSLAGSRRSLGRARPVPQAAEAMRELVQTSLAWLEGQLETRTFLCGARFSLADILLYVALRHGIETGQFPVGDRRRLAAWLTRVGERPSAERSAGIEVDAMALSGTV